MRPVLVLATLGIWLLFGVEAYRFADESRQTDALRSTAIISQKLAAWREAVKYKNFRSPLSSSRLEPPENKTFPDRHILVALFQRSDGSPILNTHAPQNPAYRITATLSFHDILYESALQHLLASRLPEHVKEHGWEGEWADTSVIMKCDLEQLDDGSWFARQYRFDPVAASHPNSLMQEVPQ